MLDHRYTGAASEPVIKFTKPRKMLRCLFCVTVAAFVRYPQYGALVVSDCDDAASACKGADHRWRHDAATGQLVSGVTGLGGEAICAQVHTLVSIRPFFCATG